MNGEKIRVVWETKEDGGRIHAAVANLPQAAPPSIHGWRRKTLPDSGATPVISLGSGDALGLFTQEDSFQSVSFRKFFWSQDTGRFDFAVLPGVNPVEMRGGEVRNEHFTIGLAMSVYEDSTTGEYQPFISVEDTVRIWSPSDLPQIVRTENLETSRLRFDVRRWVHGFDPGAPFDLFDTESVTWHADVRNVNNDTVVVSFKLGGVHKDSSYKGIDSGFVSFVRQPVYVTMGVEAEPGVFSCRDWVAASGIPYPNLEYHTQRRALIITELPSDAVLHPNVPNPFNPTTTLSFSLRKPMAVRLSVHDLMGREITVLVDEEKHAGHHSVPFHSGELPSGTYLYRLHAGGNVLTRAMTLVK